MKVVNLACRVAFEIAMVLFVALVTLAPFQAISTRHLDVIQMIDPTHAVIAGDTSGLTPGMDVPLYRLNGGWKAPILHATIIDVSDGTARIAVDLTTMSWPLGKSGTISYAEDGTARVSLGSEHRLVEGIALTIFRDRKSVGEAIVTQVGPTSSAIEIPASIGLPAQAGNAAGLIASEYSFATQAAIAVNPLLHLIESGVIALLLAIYALTYLRAKRSPFVVLGGAVRKIPFPRSLGFWLINIIAGIPFIWFLGTMSLYLIAHVTSFIAQNFLGQSIYLYPAMNALLPYAYVLLALIYFAHLGVRRYSPILAFWRFISYKGHSTVGTVSFARGLWLWALHLVIVYAFASTLWSFLMGNLGAAASIGFPGRTLEATFEYLKLLLWSLTIVGVLIGYGYSVVSILWGKYIRNLDFTIVGWLTNGFCYPLFGVVIWQMTPSFVGLDPIVTGGPLLYLMLFLGLFFNVLYTLSIFNLGVLFDLMTDKGVRTSGFYSVIRHPNYTLEACMFFATELVALSSGMHWLGILMFFFLYWIRSEREDNFMAYSNPEYREYQKKTPYKFIPGIY